SKLLNSALGLTPLRRRLDRFLLEATEPGRLLEIGFGDGSRLDDLTRLGWRVEGQEVDPVCVRDARKRGLTVHEGPLEGLGLAPGAFDAVVSAHVIEHVEDPEALLRESVRLLRPGGRLVFVTPNTDSYAHRRFRSCWYGLDPPRHLHLFNPSALAELANRSGLKGFRVVTSPAHASTVLRGSLLIRARRDRPQLAEPTLAMKLAIAAHLAVARIDHLWNRGSGEELVLAARSG
ncbi:MAG: class I SAM-dependent methyltransferase, partial [Thermoanaerobaculia bacterium]|nr:class I SAM-dependent methyltransferase [Thermoanaerobaculia bacterium]